MFRVFALLAALVASSVFAQSTPPPPDSERPIEYTFVPIDPTIPVVYIGAVGDSTGIAKQLFKEVRLDSTMMANLNTASIELVPSPGAGRFVVARYMMVKREGTVATIDQTADGEAYLSFAYGTETSGFLSPESVDFGFDARSADFIDNAFLPTGSQWFTPLPADASTIKPIANTPLRLFPSLNRQGQNLTDAQTWATITSKLSSDYSVFIRLYYQIVRL